MTAYVLRRVGALIPVWLAISLFAFTLASLAPGEPAEVILRTQQDTEPTVQEVERMRERLGLNDPFVVQYGRWVADAATGDFGTSFRTGQPVLPTLWRAFGRTVRIALPAAVIAILVAIPTGVLAAVKRNTLADHGSRFAALVLASIPSFVLGYVLIIIFAVELGWLPVAGRGGWQHIVLPATTLGVASTASMMRLMRSSLLDVLGADHITTAHAMGLGERMIVGRYALKNAMIPVVTLAGLVFAFFFDGTVIIEIVFAWPGLGRLVVDSIFQRDYPMIQGFVVFAGTIFVLVNLAVDLLYVWLDPRVRLRQTQEAGGGH